MINLLPSEEKKVILSEKTKRLILALALMFVFALICLIIILTFLRIYILIQIDSQEANLALAEKQAEDSELQIIRGKIQNANKVLKRTGSFYEQEFSLEEVLEKLIKTIPEGIYLADLSYSKETRQIVLAGFSPSQDLLVQFKDNLEEFKEKENLEKIYFPPSTWNEPVNINFSGVKIIFSQ